MGLFLCEVVGSSGAPQRERENMGCLGGWMLGYWGLVCMPAAPSVALVALSHHRSARTAPRSRLRLVRHLRHLCICLSASSCAIVATLAVTINIPSSLPWHMPLASPNLPSLGAHCRNSFSDALPRAPSIGDCALSNGVSLSSTAASQHAPPTSHSTAIPGDPAPSYGGGGGIVSSGFTSGQAVRRREPRIRHVQWHKHTWTSTEVRLGKRTAYILFLILLFSAKPFDQIR